MSQRFDSFVVFAEMRTGSNFLEANLNALDGVTCHGEAFNSAFIGYPNRMDICGIDKRTRDGDPLVLLNTIRIQPGLNGFRYFNDHDPRILSHILSDRRCAKIVLTRNPLDSYVSLLIAQETGQWKLTDVKRRKDAKVRFNALGFQTHLETLQAFQTKILNSLQTSGQTAFYIAYEDLRDVGVLNGLAAWLDVEGRLDGLDDSLKPQNPGALADKVENPEAIGDSLKALDRFNLWRTPNFEPRRGPAVPSYVLCENAPLLYMPTRGGRDDAVMAWLGALEGKAPDDLTTRKNQKDLRKWKRKVGNHRSFTVVQHPVERAHAVFCERILTKSSGSFLKVRDTLKTQFNIRLPKDKPGAGWTVEAHQDAFLGYLRFVKANLNGQTTNRVDAAWATQAQILQGFAELQSPDFVLREDRLAQDLPHLLATFGVENAPAFRPTERISPYALADIITPDIEAAVQDVYQKDFVTFGFGPWNATYSV